ncbi:hypothetical protein [Pseudomonas duriflava]|uniref:hypothetical protein n=1 Tax=Pseudomonas duriflava TaxID=459528 RepID=UPI0011A8514B|nr:hypothetical protein [Pseudomonas duriflava]
MLGVLAGDAVVVGQQVSGGDSIQVGEAGYSGVSNGHGGHGGSRFLAGQVAPVGNGNPVQLAEGRQQEELQSLT